VARVENEFQKEAQEVTNQTKISFLEGRDRDFIVDGGEIVGEKKETESKGGRCKFR